MSLPEISNSKSRNGDTVVRGKTHQSVLNGGVSNASFIGKDI